MSKTSLIQSIRDRIVGDLLKNGVMEGWSYEDQSEVEDDIDEALEFLVYVLTPQPCCTCGKRKTAFRRSEQEEVFSEEEDGGWRPLQPPF